MNTEARLASVEGDLSILIDKFDELQAEVASQPLGRDLEVEHRLATLEAAASSLEMAILTLSAQNTERALKDRPGLGDS